MLVGLSLSLCVKDIMTGKVSEWDVSKIITGTAAETEADWTKLLASYRLTYWNRFDADAAIELVQRFRALGKIEQPRLVNPHYVNTSGGHWVDAPQS